MLWIPQDLRSHDSDGKRLLRRAAPLTFGYFGAIRREDDLQYLGGGSGVLTHPFSGLTAKHVGRHVLTLDGRERLPKYAFQTQHSATIFQHLNPLEEKPKNSLWHVTRMWDSPSDLSLIQFAAGEGPHHDPVGYFKWRLLPPPVDARVHLIGFPGFEVSDVGEEFEIMSDLSWQPATVTNVYPIRRPDAAPKYPCFEVDKAVDAGFSGGAVLYQDSLCGLVSVSSTFEEKTWCATLWPLAVLEYDSELTNVKTKFSELFDRGVIIADDWHEVRGRIERREDDNGEPYAYISDDVAT